MDVSTAVRSRRSVRAFLDKPVDPALLRRLLTDASRAPSGGNIQPWHIHVVTGDRLIELKALMAKRVVESPAGEGTEYDVYPKELLTPFKERTVEVGAGLYARMGIERDDKPARARMFARNFRFFDAPVALFCYADRRHGPPQWSDMGMYLQTLMLLLREAGLDSCPQECWALYHRTIGEFLQAPAEQMLFTGMSIGWRDPDHPANSFVSERATLAEFATFHEQSPATQDGTTALPYALMLP